MPMVTPSLGYRVAPGSVATEPTPFATGSTMGTIRSAVVLMAASLFACTLQFGTFHDYFNAHHWFLE